MFSHTNFFSMTVLSVIKSPGALKADVTLLIVASYPAHFLP